MNEYHRTLLELSVGLLILLSVAAWRLWQSYQHPKPQHRVIQLLFTVGRTQSYERFLGAPFGPPKDMPQQPRKDDGGSVWRTYEEAAWNAKPDQSVYGVLADWYRETEPTGHSWNALLIAAPLIRVPPDFQRIVSPHGKIN